MKKQILAGVALICLSLSLPAMAEEDKPFSASLNIASDYVFRGISQTDEEAALQGSVDYGHDFGNGFGAYAGIWASNVDFDDGDEASLETDIYAGITYELDKWAFDAGLLYYYYPGADSSLNYDYFETKLSAAYDFEVAAVKGSFFYTPEYFGDADDAYYAELGLTVPIVENIAFDASYGYQWFNDNVTAALPDYGTWTIGASYSFEPITLGLHYVDTDMSRTECSDGCEERLVANISAKF